MTTDDCKTNKERLLLGLIHKVIGEIGAIAGSGVPYNQAMIHLESLVEDARNELVAIAEAVEASSRNASGLDEGDSASTFPHRSAPKPWPARQ